MSLEVDERAFSVSEILSVLKLFARLLDALNPLNDFQITAHCCKIIMRLTSLRKYFEKNVSFLKISMKNAQALSQDFDKGVDQSRKR